MHDAVDTSFRWPAIDERFVTTVLATAALFGVFVQVLARQPPVEDTPALSSAELPHDLGLSWSELLHKYGCDGTDPNARMCETLADGERRSRDEKLRAYALEARQRSAVFASTVQLSAAFDGAFAGLGAAVGFKKWSAPKRVNGQAQQWNLLRPLKQPVHRACASEMAPKAVLTGWVKLHIVPTGKPGATVTVVASTIANRRVVACIVDRLSHDSWLPFEQDVRYDFDAK